MGEVHPPDFGGLTRQTMAGLLASGGAEGDQGSGWGTVRDGLRSSNYGQHAYDT
jgi:hypothetical protein